MYQTLTLYHSTMRWLVLLSLLFALYRAYRGYFSRAEFSRFDNAVRHWTATVAHIQLMIGMLLYFQSPLVKYFLSNFKIAVNHMDMLFFGLIHSGGMLVAIVMITVGSAMAKRKENDMDKFRTMMIWFTLALLLIFIAIPWPFSPLANRPYYR